MNAAIKNLQQRQVRVNRIKNQIKYDMAKEETLPLQKAWDKVNKLLVLINKRLHLEYNKLYRKPLIAA